MDRFVGLSIVAGSALLLLVLASCAGLSTERSDKARDEDRPVEVASEPESGGLRADVFCSPTRIRTGIARLSWPTKPEMLERQAVDVTVFKDGFRKGFFGTVSVNTKDPLQTPDLKEPDERLLEPVLRLRIPSRTFDKERGQSLAEVENLEPGLVYLWRLRTLTNEGWIEREAVRTEAPVCVADMREAGR